MGTHVSWSAAQQVTFLIMQLIPITEFAPELYEWAPNKTKLTMVKRAATYEIMRPSDIKMLTGVTHATGTEARTLIDDLDAKQALFGGPGEVISMHDICIYAMMIYCWSTHGDSTKRDIVDTVTDYYLKTKA